MQPSTNAIFFMKNVKKLAHRAKSRIRSTSREATRIFKYHAGATDEPIDAVHGSLGRRAKTEWQSITKLCELCQNIFDNFDKLISEDEFSVPHCGGSSDLKASAEDGCSLCNQFLRSQVLELGSGDAEQLHGGKVKCKKAEAYYSPEDPDGFEVHLSFTETAEPGFGVYMLPKAAAEVAEVSNLTKFNTEEGLPLLKHWHNTCLTSHKKCETTVPTKPTRLVFIGGDVICLREHPNIPNNVTYATLSHCWGSTKYVTLTKDTIAEFRRQVPLEALPKTFRHAIKVARYLNIDYLWIDSLCIIQDNATDWRQQSSLMSSVYGESVLSIAASGADDGHGGLFFDRSDIGSCQVKLGPHQTLYHCVDYNFWDQLNRMPLLKRAWALQERILPSRTVHFTKTQVFWECHETTACESLKAGFPQNITTPYVAFEKKPVTLLPWAWIVDRYSSCALTMPTDKLVAISGLAKKIQEQTGDQYVAGLWRQDMEHQLLWIRESKGKSISASDSFYIAPSWSWASCNEAVSCSDFDTTIKACKSCCSKIVEAETSPLGENPLGSLTGGYIRVLCSHFFRGSFNSHYRFDEDLYHLLKLDESVTYPTELWILMICHEKKLWRGLLLRPTELAKGQYQRVGTIRFSQKVGNFEAFEKVSDAAYHSIELDSEGNEQRIIEIV